MVLLSCQHLIINRPWSRNVHFCGCCRAERQKCHLKCVLIGTLQNHIGWIVSFLQIAYISVCAPMWVSGIRHVLSQEFNFSHRLPPLPPFDLLTCIWQWFYLLFNFSSLYEHAMNKLCQFLHHKFPFWSPPPSKLLGDQGEVHTSYLTLNVD